MNAHELYASVGGDVSKLDWKSFQIVLSAAVNEWNRQLSEGNWRAKHDSKQDVISLINTYCGYHIQRREKVEKYINELLGEVFE